VPFKFEGNYRKIIRAHQIKATSLELADGAELWVGSNVGAHRSRISIKGRGSVVILGEHSRLYRTTISVTGEGNCVYMGPRCVVKAVAIPLVGDGNLVALGRGVTWQSGSAICTPGNQLILVGEDCMISNSVMLRTDDSHAIFDAATKKRLNPPAPVILERHVWLGNGARCNKGSRVGTGTVVGGASVVSGTLEPNCVYAGIPARKKRENIVWSRTAKWEDIPPEMTGGDNE
jgi:acetyltransferase-like isoleucine patch superfamily enzyme